MSISLHLSALLSRFTSRHFIGAGLFGA
ncbi:MAG TPA: peptide-binding protein, partial [Pseudomonas sp.]|nr:peptide-binding protein [Pseudomonas sp.]